MEERRLLPLFSPSLTLRFSFLFLFFFFSLFSLFSLFLFPFSFCCLSSIPSTNWSSSHFPIFFFSKIFWQNIFISLLSSLSPHAMWHSTPRTSKNVKFRLSRNSTKFDWIARFCETNSTMKSVFHPRSRKITFVFSAANYCFALF